MGSRGRYGKYGEIKRRDRLGGFKTFSLGSDRGTRKATLASSRSSGLADRHGFRIVPAGPRDVNYIRTLSKKVFNKYGPYDDTLAGWFLSGMAFTSLALVEKRAVGFAMLGQSPSDDLHLRIYELLAIAVEPGMQNRGIGSQLLKSIERKAQDLDIEMMILHTAADNLPGHGLFIKFGFVSSETKGGFYPAGQDALMMYKRFS